MNTKTKLWIATALAVACSVGFGISGCATRKECNIVLINQRHPGELATVLKEHQALTIDLLKVIADLENETGYYR